MSIYSEYTCKVWFHSPMSGPLRNIFRKCAGGFPHAGRRHWRGSCGIRCQVGKSEVLASKAEVNLFIFIKYEWCVIYSEGFSALEKTPCYALRGLCCPSRLVLPFGKLILKILTCCLCGSSGRMQEPATDNISCLLLFKCKKKWAKRPLLSAAGCHTWPDDSQNSLQRVGGKGTLMPDIQSRPILYTYLCSFFNSQCHHQKQ